MWHLQTKKVPAVSVILPTYNRARTLGRAILSVLNQTYQDFELLVIDDASTDDTSELIHSIDDPRIRYIRHQDNHGAGAARNSGIKAAKGRFVAFQDSDDQWLPESLEKRVNKLHASIAEDSHTGLVFSQFIREKGKKATVFPPNHIVPSKENIYPKLLEGNFISTQTTLVKRECIDDVGAFDEKLPCLLDWDLCIRLSKKYRCVFMDQALVIVTSSPDGISSSYINMAKAYEQILNKYHSSLLLDAKCLGNHYYLTGNLFILTGDVQLGRKYLRAAVQNEPKRIRYMLAYLFSLFGIIIYKFMYRLKSMVFPEWY